LQPLWHVASPRGDSNVVDRDRSRDEFRKTWWRFGAVAQDAVRTVTESPTRTIDSVYNIDRVLRCPGSVNWKYHLAPIPVRTHMYSGGGRIYMRDLVARLDRNGVAPLKSVSPLIVGIPTSLGDADEWINEQYGATLDLHELKGTALLRYGDVGALVAAMAEGEAHTTMRDKVQHAVYAAQEGHAGLVLALNNLRDAYVEVMERRERGELDGEVRDGDREWANAVIGAVAKARARKHVKRAYRPTYQPRYRPTYRPTYRKPWWE